MLGPEQESGYKKEREFLKIDYDFPNVHSVNVYINYSNQRSHIYISHIAAAISQYPVNQHLYIYSYREKMSFTKINLLN